MTAQRNILFSVVIPTYNRADLILETLETVFAQTYTNYEVLVVDNCSTDTTREILQPLIDAQKIRYICNEKNYERAYSRNVGMANASGDFLTLLDSDDFMYATCLQDALQFIHDNPALQVFHNKFEVVNNQRQVIYKTPFVPLKNQYRALSSGNFMSAIGGFISKEIYTQFRFNLDPEMIGAEDYEFWFQIFARYKAGRIEKVNCAIREHPARSVHDDAYSRLEYQCNTMVELIKKDPVLNKKFGAYTGRLKASYKLQEIIVFKNTYSIGRKLKILAAATKNDFSILFTKRYLATAINIFR